MVNIVSRVKMPKRKRCVTCGDMMTLVSIRGFVCWRHNNKNLKRICDNRKARESAAEMMHEARVWSVHREN